MRSRFLFLAAMAMVAGTARGAETLRYERMSADDLARAARERQAAIISAGIVEWHGEQSACGLDGLKAETLAQIASESLGIPCFPHLWLGPDASTPFDPERYPHGTLTIDKGLYLAATEELLTQMDRMGFRAMVYLSGHYPGVIPEVAEKFNRRDGMKVISVSENLVVQGMAAGDHAAAWETSVLMVLRPGLVDLTRLPPLPPTTRPAGDVLPQPWMFRFRQRNEYYGVYGMDPRVWANQHYGRRGVEAVITGLGAEIGKHVTAAVPKEVRVDFDSLWKPLPQQEVRYDHFLPRDWIARFEKAPIVYLPLCTSRTPNDDAAKPAEALARQTGGMVFPPLSYAPAAAGDTLAISAPLYHRIVSEIVSDLAEMNWRVVVLVPGEGIQPDARQALNQVSIARGQTQVLVLDAKKLDGVPAELSEAIRRMIPQDAVRRSLDGPWMMEDRMTIAGLGEDKYGPGDVRVYEQEFTCTEAEAGGAALLDLGAVHNRCEVVINDQPPLIDHWVPYRMMLTGMLKAGANRVRITVRHQPQPTMDHWFYQAGRPCLEGPVTLYLWKP